MNSPTTNHLTDDQFAECALSTQEAPDTATQAHLSECGQCRQELTVFQSAIGDFSQATANWSQAQPSVSLRTASLSSRWQPALGYAGLGVVAGLVLAVALPMSRHPAVARGVSPVAIEPEDSAAQIAEDNRMMRTVNMAISVNEPSPFHEYQLQETRFSRSTAHPEVRSE